MAQCECSQVGMDFFCNLARTGQVGVWQQYNKLLGAIARRQVAAAPQAAPDCLRDAAEAFVARQMAVAVVVALE